jgi:hypothetical protein
MSLTGFVNPIYRDYAHAFDQRDGPRVERIETADRRVFRWITPTNAKILGKYILRRGHHNPFLIGMRPSDRITLFIRNVVLASTLPFDVPSAIDCPQSDSRVLG